MLEVKVLNETSPYMRCKAEPMLCYNGTPMFKFGPMSETATFALKLGSAAHNVKYWAKWQRENGMGYVRCYPEQGYGWVDTEAEGRLYPFEQVEPFKFDLDRFSNEYWENFRDVAVHLRDNEIILHLQLVQVCYFKEWALEARRWQFNYWNPHNNVNDYTNNLKAIFPFSDRNEKIMNHWERYVNAILDAVGNLGNVIIDIGNELNSEENWIEWNLGIIKKWESKNRKKVIKGIDFTHMSYPANAMCHPDVDILMTHGDSVDDAPVIRKIFKKPVLCVNSSDGEYLGLAEGKDPNEDRFRRLHYRCFMNKVQGIGDYGKMMGAQDKLRTGDIEKNLYTLDPERVAKFASDSRILVDFFKQLKDYSTLAVDTDTVIRYTKGAVCHCLRSDDEIAVYLESGIKSRNDGKTFSDDELVLAVDTQNDKEFFEKAERAVILDPSTGNRTNAPVSITEYAKINLPSFKNDLLIYIKI